MGFNTPLNVVGQELQPADLFRLGWTYLCGLGVERDDNRSAYWLRRAAEQGHCEAQFELGQKYLLARGVPQDYKQAVDWFRQAAEQGHGGALLRLGWMYDRVPGVERDYNQAVNQAVA